MPAPDEKEAARRARVIGNNLAWMAGLTGLTMFLGLVNVVVVPGGFPWMFATAFLFTCCMTGGKHLPEIVGISPKWVMGMTGFFIVTLMCVFTGIWWIASLSE